MSLSKGVGLWVASGSGSFRAGAVVDRLSEFDARTSGRGKWVEIEGLGEIWDGGGLPRSDSVGCREIGSDGAGIGISQLAKSEVCLRRSDTLPRCLKPRAGQASGTRARPEEISFACHRSYCRFATPVEATGATRDGGRPPLGLALLSGKLGKASFQFAPVDSASVLIAFRRVAS